MDYKNPDSIYYAYVSTLGYNPSFTFGKATISIACFSPEGQLHFNHVLNIPDTMSMKSIRKCKVLSNGGVLVSGDRTEDLINNRGFLLLYHPTHEANNIKEYVIEQSQVFPNPAQSQFTVTNTENANIQLYNMVGQRIMQTIGKEDNTIIYTDNLPAGMYVLRLEKGSTIQTQKLQVIK